MSSRETALASEQIKKSIQDLYVEAVGNRFSSRSRSGSGIDHIFRDVKLYGHDAGTDFIETHLNAIVQEARDVARCKEASLTLPTYGYGHSAISSIVTRLRELTALEADTNASTVVLTWAKANPGLV